MVKHQVIFQEEEKVYTQVFLGGWISDKCFISRKHIAWMTLPILEGFIMCYLKQRDLN